MATKILIYQTDNIKIFADYLKFSGFDITLSDDTHIIADIKSMAYDLCILSHRKISTKIADLSLLKALRDNDINRPCIIISDLSDYRYIIQAYDNGADDYITEPYNFEIVKYKIKAVLKKYKITPRVYQANYKIGEYEFDLKNSQLLFRDINWHLTIQENQILAMLCEYKDDILTKKLIIEKVWAGVDDYNSHRSLDVQICHLRNYLKLDNKISIKTIRGLGYTLTVNEQ